LKLKYYFLLGFAVNLIFTLIPIYDSFNMYSWIGLALSLHNSAPALRMNASPATFFILIFLIPMDLVYRFTMSTYLAIITMKLILLFFYMLLVLLMLKFFQYYQLRDQIIKIIIIFIIFNPGIVFITSLAGALDIIPIFFVSLSYYFLKIRPLKTDGFNMLFSSLSLAISIFIYVYPLILIPTLIIYTKNWKQKMTILLILVVLGTT
jgi:hypothetical protein